MAEKAALRRVTDLFIEGTEMVLDENDPVLVWINKLNPFQQDEARKDGAAARTRLTLAMNNPLSEESQAFDIDAGRVDNDVIARGMAQNKWQLFLLDTADEMRVDEDWRDKAEALDRASEQLAHLPVDHPERKANTELETDYYAEMNRRTEEKREAEFQSLMSLPTEELRIKYRDAWIEQQGNTVALTEYRITELWYAMRECFSPGRDGNGRWDHSKCDHRTKLVDERNDVRQLPDGLIRQTRSVLDAIVVEERQAKDGAADRTSSESSPRPNEPATSAASGQGATSPEPAPTSTPQ